MEEERRARDGFMFYRNWWIAIANLPRDVQGDVLTAIVEYGLDGVTTEQLKPIAKAMLEMVKPVIDSNYKKYLNGLKGKDFGKLGGAPKGNKNASKQPQNNPNITANKDKTTPKQPQNNPLIIKEKENNNKSFPNVKDSSVGDAPDAPPQENSKEEINFSQLEAFFNETMANANAVIPKIQKFTDKRKTIVNARCREYGKEAILKVIVNASKSSFLNGGGSQGFKADFDWLFRPNNFPKVLEGNYNDNNHANPTNYQQQSGGFRSKLPPKPGYGLRES